MKTRRESKRTAVMILLVLFIFSARTSISKAEETAENELLLRTTIFRKENGEKKAVKSAVHTLEFGNVERLYDKDLGLLVSYFWDKKDELVITVDAKTYTDSIVLKPFYIEGPIYLKENDKETKLPSPNLKPKKSVVTNKKNSDSTKSVAAKEYVNLTKEKEQNIIFENVLVRELLMPSSVYEIQVKVIQTQKQAFYKKPALFWWDAGF